MNITMLGRMAQDTRHAEKHVEPCGDLISKQCGLRKLVTLVDILESIQKQTSLDALSSSFPAFFEIKSTMALCPTTQSFDNASTFSNAPRQSKEKASITESNSRRKYSGRSKRSTNFFFSTFPFLYRISVVCCPMATPMQLDGTLFRCEKKIALIGLNLGTD